MARTKASVGAKVSSGKSSKARCSVAPTPSYSGSSGEKSSKSHSGGNSVCQRETPKWQKPITTFFIKSKEDCNGNDLDIGTSSKSKPRYNVIESDDEDELDTPKNKELDETIELEPLTGEDSHKIDEYYTQDKDTRDNIKDKKGKGKGKKSNKENVNNNTRNSKRDLDNSIEEDESRKKIKI